LSEEEKQEAARHIYFVYNTPTTSCAHSSAAFLFGQCRRHQDQPGYRTQAITGSTRMQATTIATFVLGVVLEEASCESSRSI